MEELEKNREQKENEIGGKDLYELKKSQKDKEKDKFKRKETLSQVSEKVIHYIIYAVIGAGVIGGLIWLVSTGPNLPPITDQNHSESSPPAHIVNKPIPDKIQRHMLEHADGGDKPGIIIQYNCDDFECEGELIDKLKELVDKYPDNVYLAPNTYDGKIILTKIGRRKILDNFNEEIIKDFIGN